MSPLNDKPIEPQGQDQSRGEPMHLFSDKPIERPGKDRFGFSPFAEAIAQSIIKNKNPEGTVIAINGPWGSGKSSVINLVKHYLEEKIKSNQSLDSFEFPRRAPKLLKSLAPERRSRQPSGDMSNSSNVSLEILDFKCWWFRGEEALMIEFFHQLYSALNESGLGKARAAISQLASILSSSASLIGKAVSSVVPVPGNAVSNGMNLVRKLIEQEETVEKLYDRISQDLKKKDKRYLMIIDDIDRLSKDEALLIFRLIKSVGRLPKVTYLLAYDREVTEKIVSESEGPRYLEKIVQASFDIPYPLRSNLRDFFINHLDKVWEEPRESKYWREYQASRFRHFLDLFHDVVEPQIQSPRDVIRITNTLKVSWPAVAGEVDPADFMALETLRIQQPRLHAILKVNREQLTGRDPRRVGKKNDITASRYEDIFLGGFQNEKRTEMKRALRSLFPSLGTVWRDTSHGSALSDNEWDSQRRACSPKHFDTYFRLSLSTETINIEIVYELIRNSNDINYVKTELLEANKIQTNNRNGTYASVLLDELRDHAGDISIENAENFLSVLFAIHDAIDTESAQSIIKVMHIPILIDNSDRIYYLLRSFLSDRTDLVKRSSVICHALQNGSLGWIAFFVFREYCKYHPQQDQSPTSEDEYFLTEADLEGLRQMVLEKIRAAAESANLLKIRKCLFILRAWKLFEEHEEVKTWCMEKLNEDTIVEEFAKTFLSYRMGSDFIETDELKQFFDTDRLKQRVKELQNASQRESKRYVTLKLFIDALEPTYQINKE